MASTPKIEKLAMIGCGSMGGGMALLFAEHGIHVSLSDPSEEAMDSIIKEAEKDGIQDKIQKVSGSDYKKLCESLGSPKVLVFSLPHGTVGDGVVKGLLPHMSAGDIILDAANEHYENTERRQGLATTKGIRYVGMGVSGGYQAARRGPSICPGADEMSLNIVMPLLEMVAAKSADGKACVAPVGFGGSGHYVKMLHNGIEHGMMSAISEAWQLMNTGLGMSYEEIGDVFEKWNSEGELKGTFLIKIGADICRTKDDKGNHILANILDKVVQDITGEEGTGVWSQLEAVDLHVPAPTLTSAHYFRIASAFRGERERFNKTIGGGFEPQKLDVSDKAAFVEALRIAVYTASLASYVQGINVIEAADKKYQWSIDYASVWQIWRGGCIIQADGIAEIIKPIMQAHHQREHMNFLYEPAFAKPLKSGYASLKKVVLAAIGADHVVPSLSATLEYMKYQSNLDLPTSFYEAELDYFGKHMYDEKGDRAPGPTEGRHHFEWKPA